jgi:hypothetical protein
MMIDGHMEPAAVKTANRTLASHSDLGKDPMAGNAQVVAYNKRAGSQNGNDDTASFEMSEQGDQRHGIARHQLKAAVVTRETGKFRSEKPQLLEKIKALEFPIAQLIKQNCQGHHLRQSQQCGSLPLLPDLSAGASPIPVRSLGKSHRSGKKPLR